MAANRKATKADRRNWGNAWYALATTAGTAIVAGVVIADGNWIALVLLVPGLVFGYFWVERRLKGT